MKTIQNLLAQKQKEMLILLERLVNIDSGSSYKEGIDMCGNIIADELKNLNFSIEIIQQKSSGNHILCKRAGKGDRHLLLLAHLDTVWPKGTVMERPYTVKGNHAYGPGVGDMKGGIVMMLYALKALYLLDLETLPLSIFLTGDEENGSVTSRSYIESEGKQSDYVFVMEGAVSPYTLVTERWGVGAFTVIIHGKPAHVLDPENKGVNACRELALKILSLEAISDWERGILVSVNQIRGGTARQVTAGKAEAAIDVRVKNAADMYYVETELKKRATESNTQDIKIELHGGMTRPPMEPNEQTKSLLQIMRQVGNKLNIDIIPGKKAGGSDGSFTAAMGIPTIDGMGPIGSAMCSDRENIEISSIVPRTALLAETICRLTD